LTWAYLFEKIYHFYDRDKKKEFASNHSAYYPFGVDVFLSPRKIDHIARFVELPLASPFGKLPPLLVVNVQVLIFFFPFLMRIVLVVTVDC